MVNRVLQVTPTRAIYHHWIGSTGERCKDWGAVRPVRDDRGAVYSDGSQRYRSRRRFSAEDRKLNHETILKN